MADGRIEQTEPRQRKKLVPSCVLFKDRPISFITNLQTARLNWLIESPERKRKEKQLNKGPKVAKTGGKTKRLTKSDQRMLELMKGFSK